VSCIAVACPTLRGHCCNAVQNMSSLLHKQLDDEIKRNSKLLQQLSAEMQNCKVLQQLDTEQKKSVELLQQLNREQKKNSEAGQQCSDCQKPGGSSLLTGDEHAAGATQCCSPQGRS